MYCFNVAHVFYEMRDSSSCDILMCNNIANSFLLHFVFVLKLKMKFEKVVSRNASFQKKFFD